MTKLVEAMGTIGTASIGVGIAITGIASALEGMGLEGASDAAAKAGSVFTIFGTVLMALPPIMKILGITFSSTGFKIAESGLIAQLGWWPFIAILLAVIAVVGILAAVFIHLSKNSPEGKLKAAEGAAEAAGEAAEAASDPLAAVCADGGGLPGGSGCDHEPDQYPGCHNGPACLRHFADYCD
jgi:hypothetical protein